MAKLFADYTHVLLRTCPKGDAEKTGVFAYADVCFGPGDEHSLANIPLKSAGARRTGFCSPLTVVLRDGKQVYLPTLRGQVADRVLEICSHAADRIKKDLGKIEYNRVYRVTSRSAVDETPGKKEHVQRTNG